VERVDARDFLEFIFDGLSDGYLCIATIERKREHSDPLYFQQHYFWYPDEVEDAVQLCVQRAKTCDVYFAPFLLNRKRRKKVDILETSVVWSDGDNCPLDALLLPPSAVVRSSIDGDEEKYHFYWKFETPTSPDVGESISKRVAYYHAEEGMDRSGWDLTQLLRVPDTFNHKYRPRQKVSQAVIFRGNLYHPDDFKDYPEVQELQQYTPVDEVELPEETGQEILIDYKNQINPKALKLFKEIPGSNRDWSKSMYELECILIEGELTLPQVFRVCWDAACNKYARDNRPQADLWREIQRVASHIEAKEWAPPDVDKNAPRLVKPQLLTEEEREAVKRDKTFIEEYTEWAKQLGDAAVQYHPAGAFVILSSLLCGTINLPTRFGTIIPNLWFMILADTTLTRKTTAMDNATDLLLEVHSDILLATDGSIEGLLTAMSNRSGKPSLFLRDEITGLIDAISKKEYLAGMMEMLTKLYDGKHMKRILRKETIDVRDPRLVLFAGGIRNKMVDLLTTEHVSSGFLPRFIFITAESDTTKLKPIGPPTTENITGRENLFNRMVDMYEHYRVQEPSTGGRSTHIPREWAVQLTEEAWLLYNHYEMTMLEFAMKSHDPALMTPVMDRLAKSGLKASVLIGASRKLAEEIVITVDDLKHAFFYIEQWMDHTIYMMKHIGFSTDEKKLKKVLFLVDTEPGIRRSSIMQRCFLNSRDAEQIFVTLEQRAQIRRTKKGNQGERFYPLK
jgi:hypothetical protein